jgi:transcriptional regulator with XRE-family HTH domain
MATDMATDMERDDELDRERGALAHVLIGMRKRAGLSQRRLADAAGISQATIRDIETGKQRKPRWDTLRMLARGVDLALDGDGDAAPTDPTERPTDMAQRPERTEFYDDHTLLYVAAWAWHEAIYRTTGYARTGSPVPLNPGFPEAVRAAVERAQADDTPRVLPPLAPVRPRRARPAAEGIDRLLRERRRIFLGLTDALYDYDHGDEMTCIETLRRLLAALGASEDPPEAPS